MNHRWKFSFFIANTLQKRSLDAVNQLDGSKKESRPITKIATISIALAVIVNSITLAVVNGFQQEVREKVIGFGSHITIQKSGEGSLFESNPLKTQAGFVELLKQTTGIVSVQPIAYKPALFQSVDDNQQREILGVVMKGVESGYDWSFIRSNLKQGRVIEFSSSKTPSSEIVLSKKIARDLHYKLGDTINAYFVKQRPILRKFTIVGIYETGLEEFDKEMVFCHLPQVQQLNDWGIQASIIIDDTLTDGQLIIRGEVAGGNGNFRYDWGKGFEKYAGFAFCPTQDTTIRLIAADYWTVLNEPTGKTDLEMGETTIPDTAYLKISVTGNRYSLCQIKLNLDNSIAKNYFDSEGFQYEIDGGEKKIRVESIPGKGSEENYIGSYEILVSDWEKLDEIKRNVSKTVLFQPDFQQQVQVKSIKDHQNDLFVWLGFLDLNMAIILVLMLIIGIINMGSALLVMIIVRTNFIGIFKALGATNWNIREIFIIQAASLILKGMFWGNVIGIGFCYLQQTTGILSLDPKVYYLDQVPISINWWTILGLNVLTLTICLLALLIPSVVITRIRPSKAIRFK